MQTSGRADFRTPRSEMPVLLTHGEFFGLVRRERRTESFAFARMQATWSRDELPRHTHDNAYFCFILSGRYITAASPELCGPGALIFNPPGTTHRDRFQGSVGKFLTVSVSPELSQRMASAPEEPVLVPDVRVLRVIHDIHDEMRQGDRDSGLVLEGLGLELAGRVANLRRWPDRSAPKWLLRSREVLREHCGSNVTVAMVARAAGIHPVHLARCFRQYFHCSPGEYLRACRVEKARELLRVANLSLGEIAQRAGYCDQSQFTHSFRRATGSTPGEYRRMLS